MDLRLRDLESSLRYDFTEGMKNFKELLENYLKMLNDLKRLKTEGQNMHTSNLNHQNSQDNKQIINNTFNVQQFINTYTNRTPKKSMSINKPSFDGHEDDALNPNENIVDTRRRFTKNIIKKVGVGNSSTLLNSLWHNLRNRKFGSFADINEDNILQSCHDTSHLQLFKQENSIISNQPYLSTRKIPGLSEIPRHSPLQTLSNNQDPNPFNHFTPTNKPVSASPKKDHDNLNSNSPFEMLVEENSESEGGNRNDFIIRRQSKIGSSKILRKISGGAPRFSLLEKSPMNFVNSKDYKNLKASIMSQNSIRGSFLMHDDQINEIKQLKGELSMYKTQTEMLTRKFQSNSILKNELQKMLDTYENKNKEIYKTELKNMSDCFDIYKGFYEEELNSRREIIDELCKIIEEMKLK